MIDSFSIGSSLVSLQLIDPFVLLSIAQATIFSDSAQTVFKTFLPKLSRHSGLVLRFEFNGFDLVASNFAVIEMRWRLRQ